ncbi:MAG: glycosyltransferase family 4 protein [Algoriphagus sp.]|uniref:glycosyltransferase family 4 protein n=1 Tax=Algoriphagus sp. TaxID=1872435 RepID=UPI00183B923A|nr:glycosyltransferase family 1 protein [Algoriphagus sp.]NVJ85991.1 glycosyltransferase family 4 protein [Algoriphagus sp.]
MKRIRVNFIFRKQGEGHNSIEELFHSIIANLPEEIDTKIVELPYGGASIKSVLLNLWHVLFLKGIIHVTGDVYYIGLIPFKKTILTIHDTNVLELPYISSLKKVFIKWFWYSLPLKTAKRITVISDFTKNQIKEIYPKALKKTVIIHNPVNPILETKPKQEVAIQTRVLHLGTKPHKNLTNTVKATYKLGYKLIIVGKLSENQKALLLEYPVEYENYTNLDFSEIKALYETCDLVSFVSYLEGFGMPIIEAQKVGRPVVASDRCSIPEVGGHGAVYVNPDEVEAMVKAYKRVVEDPLFRNQLIKRGFENVKRFEVPTVCSAYAKVYEELEKR